MDDSEARALGYETLPVRWSNLRIAEAFASAFDPPLAVNRTDAVNGMPVTNGYMLACHDAASGVGVTCVVFGDGQLHAYLEAALRVNGDISRADAALRAIQAGYAMAKGEADGR